MEKPSQFNDPIEYSLIGATLVTPTEVLRDTDLTVLGRRFARSQEQPGACCVNMTDHLIFPGLINAHDHLNGTWWPRVAPHRPYANVYQWLDDLHTSSERTTRQQNSVEDIYELGMYRNLVSGVTTVADHYLRIGGPEFYARLLIDVLFEYGRTWTPREVTGWGDDVSTEYDLAVRTGQPYIIHLAEGIDCETAQEMDVLLAANALGRNTLIIHGISLRPEDMRAMSRAGASVCWCPSSNLYLYDRTADIPALLDAGINITLGTDSSLSGGLNLLDELRTARDFAKQTGLANPRMEGDQRHTDQNWLAKWLVESVTTNAAYALLREGRRGRIAPGYDADLLVLRKTKHDPYTTLIDAHIGDICLLCRGGIPIYGDPIYRPLFEQFTPCFTSTLVADPEHLSGRSHGKGQYSAKTKLIAGDPLALLDRLSHAVGRAVEFPFLPLASSSEKKTSPSH
jgi:5-methylthioadenosine/S-adenosylhomocysteine deaminase